MSDAPNTVVVHMPALQRARLPSTAASEAVSLIGLIERLSADPACDVERIERMYGMLKDAQSRAAKSAYVAAFMQAKNKLPKIIKTGEILIKDKKQSSFARWEDVCSQIEPVLAANDLALSFRTEQPGLDRVIVTAVLTHVDGHSESAQMALAIENSGSKNNAQGWGSAISYGKRYTSFALLNLVGHDDKDTDGVVSAETISDEQEADIRDALEAKDITIERFCNKYQLQKLGDLQVSKFSEAIAAIKRHA